MSRLIKRCGWIPVLCAAIALLACNKGAGGPGKGPSAGEPYTLTVEPPAPAKAGQSVVASIRVVPRGGYKMNLEYPTKLKVQGPAAATPRELTLTGQQAAKLTEGELVFKPGFSVTAGGAHRFQGALRFSVCTDEQCEIKEEKVEWTAKVE